MAARNNQRFEAIEEPMGGWMVWDTARDIPAEFGEVVLVGLTGSTAAEMTEILNDAATTRLEALGSCPPPRRSDRDEPAAGRGEGWAAPPLARHRR